MWHGWKQGSDLARPGGSVTGEEVWHVTSRVPRVAWPAQRARPLLLALAVAALAAASLAVGVWTRPGQQLDAALATLVHERVPGSARQLLDQLARPLIPWSLTPVAAILSVWGLVRGLWKEVAAVAVSTAAIPLSRWLQEAVDRPDLGVAGYRHNTFPSTHAAAAFVVVTAVILLWPRTPGRPPPRPIIGLGAAVALLAAVGNVSWWAHRPVDVLGSLALTEALVLTVLALTRWRFGTYASGTTSRRPTT